MLVRLLYASRAVDTRAETIESILNQSRQFNPTSGITGILCYGGGIFLQAIEGGRTAVSDLYGHIQKDTRHKDVVLLHYDEISERRFGGWTMGQVDASRVNTNIKMTAAIMILSAMGSRKTPSFDTVPCARAR